MKLWGGRFRQPTAQLVERFNASIDVDRRLYRQDIQGSIAHARMLGRCGIITAAEARELEQGLITILEDLEQGHVELSPEAEDIHMNVEKILTERLGVIGQKLHTARSRNDQVALDLRLYLKQEIALLACQLLDLERTLVELAVGHLDSVMPGYTHLQKAQPVTLAHHLMAYWSMFQRDLERFRDAYRRTDISPLGSGALAGTTLAIDRQGVARDLGFSSISINSIDAVSDRDFAVEFCSCAAITMMHLSRFCEELVIWNTEEFGFVVMSDAFTTGSSIMPQKKNPDVAELVRGKTGRVYGDLVALLTILKSLPLAYNKDMQEDKPPVFDAGDTLKECLEVFTELLRHCDFKTGRMRRAAGTGFTNATDVADYLVRQQVPFREAHRIVGELVLYCTEHEKTLEELTGSEWSRFSPVLDERVRAEINLEQSVARRSVPGGPGGAAVQAALEEARRWMDSLAREQWLQ